MNLKDEIFKLTNTAPSIRDDQDLSDDETAAKLDLYSSEAYNEFDGVEDNLKRLRPHVDLAQYSKKYDGKVAKRSELFDEDDFEDGNSEDDDDHDDQDDDDGDETEGDIEDDGGEDDEEEDYGDSQSQSSKTNDEYLDGSEQESSNDAKLQQKTENIKLINTNNEELKKGKAVKSQLCFWDILLDHRMKFQSILKTINEYPNHDELDYFVENLSEQGKSVFDENKNLSLVLFNEIIDLNKNFNKLTETNENFNVKLGSEKTTNKKRKSNAEIKNEAPKMLKFNEIEADLKHRYSNYLGERNDTLQKWYDKTSLMGSKSMKALEKPILQQLENLLMDKDRIIKRTRLKRIAYNKIMKTIVQDEGEVNTKEYDAEIFDDQDIYQQLLREIINRGVDNLKNSADLSKNSLALQKIKSSKKKLVDTKASKGRKLRFNVHKQLVSFMAPIVKNIMSEEAKNDLFAALFGSHATFSI